MTSIRHVWHLATRFFGVLLSRPLGPQRQDEVYRVLTPPEAELFFRQQPIDQQHAYIVAHRVAASLPGNNDAIAAALLHDVGKAHSAIGPVARSVATVVDALHLPMPALWRSYREHGTTGAVDLEAAGARPLAVAFAAGRFLGNREVWDALVAADNGPGWEQLPGGLGESPASGTSRNTMPPEVTR